MRVFALAMMALATASAARAGTKAVSREAVFYVQPRPQTLAVSREAVFYLPVENTRAISREATYFVNYRLPDVALALRLAAGLTAATPLQVQILNADKAAPSATVVDVLDAAVIAGDVGHPERLP